MRRKSIAKFALLTVAVVFTTFHIPFSSVNADNAGTVFRKYSWFNPCLVGYSANYTYVTTFGNYSFSRKDGSYQFVWRNGTVLASSVRFVAQHFVNGSWEDFIHSNIQFLAASNTTLTFKLSLFNQTTKTAELTVTAKFWRHKPPKLSAVFSKTYEWSTPFRITFKVTVPQAWKYLLNEETNQIALIPEFDTLTLNKRKVLIVPTASTPYKLGLLVDWSDFGVATCHLKGSTITVFFENVTTVDPTTVAQTSSGNGYPTQRKGFTAKNRDWIFYFNGSHILYKTSADMGVSWSSETVVASSFAAEDFCLYYNGTHVAYARRGKFRLGVPNNDGTITWITDEQTFASTGYYPSIVLDPDGYPYIAYSTSLTLNGKLNLTKSKFNNGTWTTASGFPIQVKGTTVYTWFNAMVALSNGDIYVVYTTGDEPLYGRLYNGTLQWEETILLTSLSNPDSFSAATDGDNVHVVFQKSNRDIAYTKRTAGEWLTPVTIGTTDLHSSPTISIDGQNIYVFWSVLYEGIYHNRFRNGSWTTQTLWINEENIYQHGSLNSWLFHHRLAVIWVAGSSSPLQLRFAHYPQLTVAFSTDNPSPHVGNPVTISWTITRLDDSLVTNFVINITRNGQLWKTNLSTFSTTETSDSRLTAVFSTNGVKDTVYNLTVYQAQPVTVVWSEETGGGGGPPSQPLPTPYQAPPSVAAPNLALYGSFILLGIVAVAVVVSQVRRQRTLSDLFRSRTKRRRVRWPARRRSPDFKRRWRRRYG